MDLQMIRRAIALLLMLGCSRSGPHDDASAGDSSRADTSDAVASAIEGTRGDSSRALRGWMRDTADIAPSELPLPGCLGPGGSTGMPTTNRGLGVPDAPADRVGWITSAERGAIRIVSDPCDPDEAPSLVVVPDAAHVMQRVGHRASAELLRAGHRVSIWLAPAEGAEAGAASAVVIERMVAWPPEGRSDSGSAR